MLLHLMIFVNQISVLPESLSGSIFCFLLLGTEPLNLWRFSFIFQLRRATDRVLIKHLRFWCAGLPETTCRYKKNGSNNFKFQYSYCIYVDHDCNRNGKVQCMRGLWEAIWSRCLMRWFATRKQLFQKFRKLLHRCQISWPHGHYKQRLRYASCFESRDWYYHVLCNNVLALVKWLEHNHSVDTEFNSPRTCNSNTGCTT